MSVSNMKNFPSVVIDMLETDLTSNKFQKKKKKREKLVTLIIQIWNFSRIERLERFENRIHEDESLFD